jgi:hypothetical protein
LVAQDASTSSAPVIKSKKGEAYLPVADEWGLGVSATPFLNYIGNFLNGATATNGSPNFNFATNPATGILPTSSIAIFGKKVVDANTAYRVRFNVSVGTSIRKQAVVQDHLNANPAYPSYSEDWQKTNTTAVVIAPGLEKRRGSTRLQGVYGAEAVIGLNNTNVTYQYGNPITADFTSPTSTNFGPNLLGPVGPTLSSVRLTEDKFGATWLFGARGFIGVEYFIVPKISLGGEFGYMISYRTQRREVSTRETFDQATLAIRQTKVDNYPNPGLTNVGIGLDNLNAAINLLFYF